MSEKKDPRAEEHANQLSELVSTFPTRGEYDRMRVMQLEQEVETLKAELAAFRSPTPALTDTLGDVCLVCGKPGRFNCGEHEKGH